MVRYYHNVVHKYGIIYTPTLSESKRLQEKRKNIYFLIIVVVGLYNPLVNTLINPSINVCVMVTS